ncbi:2367_t:CDS:2, partial [Racocetra persica]
PISGQIPSNRSSFANVLEGLDNKRIIVLADVVNFQWYRPNVSVTIPSNRGWHMANLIGKYMVISFGLGYSQTNESDILLLDISNDNNIISMMIKIIIGILVGILISILLIVGGFIFYKNKLARGIPTPGNEKADDSNNEVVNTIIPTPGNDEKIVVILL